MCKINRVRINTFFLYRSDVKFQFSPALKDYDTSPLSPHHDAKQKVKENLWDIYFADNGWSVKHTRYIHHT